MPLKALVHTAGTIMVTVFSNGATCISLHITVSEAWLSYSTCVNCKNFNKEQERLTINSF